MSEPGFQTIILIYTIETSNKLHLPAIRNEVEPIESEKSLKMPVQTTTRNRLCIALLIIIFQQNRFFIGKKS